MYNNYTAINEVANDLIRISDGIALYGAGGNAAGFIVWCKQKNLEIKILCIADSDVSKQGNMLLGIPIIAPGDLLKYGKDICIVVTPFKSCFAIADMLNSLGFNNIFYAVAHNARMAGIIDMKNAYIRDNNEELRRLMQENSEKISTVRQYFSHDKKSLQVFEAKLSSSFTGEGYLDLEKLHEDNQYFPSDIITLTNKEVFVDCGAYDGATTVEFVKRASGVYSFAYVFEADKWNYEVTQYMLSHKNIEKYHVFNTGVCDCDGNLTFKSAGDSGKIDEDGDVVIPVTTLDTQLLNEEYRPTFIKMDIEGAELMALEGSKGLIERDKPKFAVSVYHGMPNTHIFEIPYWFITNFPAYTLYLRQHAGYNETVLYAVP